MFGKGRSRHEGSKMIVAKANKAVFARLSRTSSGRPGRAYSSREAYKFCSGAGFAAMIWPP